MQWHSLHNNDMRECTTPRHQLTRAVSYRPVSYQASSVSKLRTRETTVLAEWQYFHGPLRP